MDGVDAEAPVGAEERRQKTSSALDSRYRLVNGQLRRPFTRAPDEDDKREDDTARTEASHVCEMGSHKKAQTVFANASANK